MRKKKPGFSLGSILTLCLTALVVAGCIFLFGKMRGPGADARMDARQVIGAVQSAFQGGGTDDSLSSVRTVTVTLAPATPLPAPEATPLPAPEATQPPATNQPAQALYPPHSFSLTVGGLLSFESDISDSVYNKTDKTLDLSPVVSLLSGKMYADLNLVTLPQTVNTADRKYSDTLAPLEAAEAIRALGADQVALGTEHILNYGPEGAENTVAALRERGLDCLGVNAQGAGQSLLLPINGGTVALLSYTDVMTTKTKNALTAQPRLMTVYSADAARRDIQAARNAGARCVIVCMYWGKRDATAVTAAQKATARELAEMGADVILGSRPSRVLPMELIVCQGPDGRQKTAFVAYSLGSLLTESREGYDISGMLLHLNLRSDEQGLMHFESLEYTPTYIWRQNVGGKLQYRLVCSADPAPEGMSDQQKEIMGRSLVRVQTTLKDSPVRQRQ